MSRRSILITGASTGIGRASALHFVQQGHLVFACVRKESDGTALTDAVDKASKGTMHPLILDVTKADQIAAAVVAVDRVLEGSPLSALVNNAGVAVAGPMEHMDLERLRWQLEVNVIGVVAVTQAFLPAIHRGTGGRISHVSSVAGSVVTPFMGPYCASKFALEAITRAMRAELMPFGIKVSSIAPGPVKTEIWDKARVQQKEVLESLSEAARIQYAEGLKAIVANMEKNIKSAVPAKKVVDAIDHALFAKRPKLHYLVGPPARIGYSLNRILPQRAMEWVLRKA